MFKKNKHIALGILLIFTFPLIFQNIHSLNHHVCLHHIEKNQTEDINEYIGFYTTPEHESCLICEYEFTTFETISVLIFYFRNISIVSFQPICNVNNKSIFPTNFKLLRAPPVFFSPII